MLLEHVEEILSVLGIEILEQEDAMALGNPVWFIFSPLFSCLFACLSSLILYLYCLQP